MHLTIRTSLAMRTLMFCAANPGRIVRRAEIAEACGASENHLAQVIYLLAQHGFLHTIRGRAGGLTLARAPETISVGEVFRQFEKVLPFSDCIGHENPKCPLAGACRLTCVLSSALEQFYETLDRSMISDLVGGNLALEERLQLPIAC
ncbi:RrF2 family transcriptional regulator [Pseudogemmobacter faecipullorum]|uniref:Rrf2 family transcriptional regulator n=1 Tax=Pseudogemmobacter faecipullorum TaxID=2755041 RepID=A0ABS8CK23_9RHOB|nr:Rrf2 family transcriptional regulator [Pseudogemmobacter faecipullorum]MCB5409752.1 Rrf2 family transcriptional regulator [Pseudogemmobacter faecipullorum]